MNSDYKRVPILNIDERCKIITECKYVDQIIKNCPLILTDEYLNNLGINLFMYACVDDAENERYLKNYFNFDISRINVKRLNYTSNISTSDIINRIKNRY